MLFFAALGYAFSEILLEDVLFWYHKLIVKLPEWLYKPLGGCAVCFTGQLTFWGGLPFWKWNYASILMYFGIVAINMIVVQILVFYAQKNRLQ